MIDLKDISVDMQFIYFYNFSVANDIQTIVLRARSYSVRFLAIMNLEPVWDREVAESPYTTNYVKRNLITRPSTMQCVVPNKLINSEE